MHDISRRLIYFHLFSGVHIEVISHTKSECIPALIVCRKVESFPTVHSTDVKTGILLQCTRPVIGIIVSFVFQLEAQRLPGSLILNTTKYSHRAFEELLIVNFTAPA